MCSPSYIPLLDSYRCSNIDCRYYAIAAFCDSGGKITYYGDPTDAYFCLRSALKPIQASILTEQIISHFGFSDSEIAVMQASHSGQKIHIDCVNSILNKIGLSKNYLLCPVILPLNTKESMDFNSPVFNNCSGKHALMLAVSKYFGYDISNYTNYNHPVQELIRSKIENLGITNYLSATDGCTMPVYSFLFDDIIKLFLNYYNDSKNAALIASYKSNPDMIGGEDNFGTRLDTKIMKLSSDLISKVGAGGFVYVYNCKTNELLVVKMAQDNNFAREIIALEILYRLNWLNKRYYDNGIYLENGQKAGEYKLNCF